MKSRWTREIFLFLGFVLAGVAVIPPLVALLAYQSRQAMFGPALEALYTYFFVYTVLASIGLALVIESVRLVVYLFRRRRL